MIPIFLDSQAASALAKDLARRADRGHLYFFAGPIEGRRVRVEAKGLAINTFTINDVEFGPAEFKRKMDLKAFIMRSLV